MLTLKLQSLVFNPRNGLDSILENKVTDPVTKEYYVQLAAPRSVNFLQTKESQSTTVNRTKANGTMTNGVNGSSTEHISELKFVPYYFRANRGGRGHMRVGLRKP